VIAATVMWLKVPGGMVKLEVEPPDAKVEVVDGKITVSRPGDAEPWRIEMAGDKGVLKISKAGFVIETREVTLGEKGQTIRVELQPEKPPVPAAVATADGFVPLFNGKDLTGWYVESGGARNWRVEGEAIVARSDDYRTRNHLLTFADYGDFVLQSEFMVDPRSSSAVDIRAKPGETVPYNGQMLSEHPLIKLTDQDRFPREPSGTTNWLQNEKTYNQPATAAPLTPGQWNSMVVTVRGQVCTADIDGIRVVDVRLDPNAPNPGTVDPGLRRPKGKIGFQAHTGTVRFRNVRIKELSSRPADGPAPAAAGFVPLFNGKDLSGWTPVGGAKWSWAGDRLLGSQGPATSRSGFLMTDSAYDDFELELQYRLGVAADSGVFLRADPNNTSGKGQFEIQVTDDDGFPGLNPIGKTGSVWNVFPRKVTPPIKRGDWNALRVRLEKRHVEVWVNGVQTIDADLDTAGDKLDTVPGLTRTSGRIGLQKNQSSYVEFRDVRIKRLTPPADQGFVPLFNGKDLRASLPGQRGKPWFVVDGILGNDSRGGSIFTEKTFTDFDLSMEFQISADTAASIDIWSYPGDTPIWVFLENTRNAMGAITFENKDKGFSVRRLNPPAELRPDGQWNELKIDCSGGDLTVSLNGRALDTVNIRAHVEGRRSDSPPAERLKGRIGLTKRWGNGKILVRKLSIEEL
jgi:hypothetical protein